MRFTEENYRKAFPLKEKQPTNKPDSALEDYEAENSDEEENEEEESDAGTN